MLFEKWSEVANLAPQETFTTSADLNNQNRQNQMRELNTYAAAVFGPESQVKKLEIKQNDVDFKVSSVTLVTENGQNIVLTPNIIYSTLEAAKIFVVEWEKANYLEIVRQVNIWFEFLFYVITAFISYPF